MRTAHKIIGLAGLGLIAAAAAPVQAQSDRERREGVVQEVLRGVEEAAETAARVDDALRGASRQLRFRGAERYAVEACEVRAERYGRVAIDDVVRYKRNSWRVYGVADPGSRYDRRYDYDRRYEPRRFVCTARTDGRVTKFKTDRIRRYR